MTDTAAVARPYAQAVFELAQAAGDYVSWSNDLAWLAAVVQDAQIQELVQNPRVERAQLRGLLEDLGAGRVSEGALNLVRLLLQNDRLLVLPAIAAQYEVLRADAERQLNATLVTARDVNAEQIKRITLALEKRLGRKVNLKVEQDPALIGGAVIRAGDLVIDGSAQSRLQKLAGHMLR